MKNSPRNISIGAQMAIAIQLIKRKKQRAITNAGYNITMEQLGVLEMLQYKGDMNMTELSNAVWKQNANITRIVDKLEKRNLLMRKPVDGDRRAYLISITNKGITLLKEVLKIVVESDKDIFSEVTKDEKEVTINTLKKIISNISQN